MLLHLAINRSRSRFASCITRRRSLRWSIFRLSVQRFAAEMRPNKKAADHPIEFDPVRRFQNDLRFAALAENTCMCGGL
jgi:hypothetical protein